MAQKVCPVVFRVSTGGVDILAFRHPSAGKQFVKGSINDGETSIEAAIRELKEESGITAGSDLFAIGQASIGEPSNDWLFFAAEGAGLSERWEHQTENDFGHEEGTCNRCIVSRCDAGGTAAGHQEPQLRRRN